MWEKIKNFFSSAAVKIAAWVVLFLDIAVLFIGGATKAELVNAVEIALAAIAGIVAIIAFICERVKKE